MLQFADALIRVFAAAMFLGGIGVVGPASAAPRAPGDDVDLSGAAIAGKTHSPPESALTPTQDPARDGPPSDPTTERTKYLHDRLRITPAQEPLWSEVATVMRENADAVAPLISERVHTAQRGSAIDALSAYRRLGAAQLEGLDKSIAAFEALYAGLSDAQKRIADSLFRLGPMGMIGGIPQLAEQMIAPPIVASFPIPPSYSIYPAYPSYPIYPPYFYAPAYVPYPSLRPWFWSPPFGLGTSFIFLHRHGHHHQGLHHPGHSLRAPLGQTAVTHHH